MFKKIAIHSFLLTFLLMSCASSGGSSDKSTAAQRAVETREYDVSSRNLMQSTIGAFQDLGFTIDTLSEEFGLITASKIEEPKKEESDDNIGLLGALVAAVAIGAILSSDWNDDDNCLFCDRNDGGETVIVKDYKLTATVTVKAINDSEPYLSSLRVTFGGSERKRSMQFFREFFTAIDKSLFLDES
ncbi:MAG: hypothetical protein O3A49_01640 [Candidatus Marinimicrobia bacterium]|nr:hypothetical protein [Candidatus Neomarinimicrobiota bacterium]MDA1363728.1 hypothetical protein [Candidatus Neomarinimicrobiota bacterium]